MNYIDLFSGIGGFALGAYWAGMKFDNHYFSEVEPYAVELYQKRFPDAIPLGDVTKHKEWKLEKGEYIVTGGFPCQPFSTASRGRRVANDLWPEMLGVIETIHPTWVISENVSFKAIEKAWSDIGGAILEIPASALGAVHHRQRYWLLSNPYPNSEPHVTIYEKMASLQSIPRFHMWESPPCFVGVDDGLPGKMDRLKGLGNAISPQIAELLFRQISLQLSDDVI